VINLPQVLLAFLALVLSGATNASLGQEAEHEAAAAHEEGVGEHESHANFALLFLGASTHLEPRSTGGTIGLGYQRRLNRLWSIGLMGEYSGSRIERDFIFLLPIVASPWHGLRLTIGPGIEFKNLDVPAGEAGSHETARLGGVYSLGLGSEAGSVETEEESETEVLARFGAGWEFEVGRSFVLTPALFADLAGSKWTLVYGLEFGYGF
jgi:hypothetical protein